MRAKRQIVTPVVQNMVCEPFSALAYDDWAYHQNVLGEKSPREGRWTVTHIPSGRAVRHFSSKEKAKQLAKQLGLQMTEKWDGKGIAPVKFISDAQDICQSSEEM